MVDWFRSWHGAPTDHKWTLIAKKAGVPPIFVSAIWWALLDHASQESERGYVGNFDVETYAHYAGVTERDVTLVLDALTGKGLILNGWLVKWGGRQPGKEDITAADRKRAQRARDSAECENLSNDKSLSQDDNGMSPRDKHKCHAASRRVTPRHNRREESRVEEIREDISSLRSEMSDATAPDPPAEIGPRFEEFWEAYPRDRNMSRKEAHTTWGRLKPPDRLLAIRSLPNFKAFCASNPTYRPVHACRYLSQRRFEGFDPDAAVPDAPRLGLSDDQMCEQLRGIFDGTG